MACSAVSQGNHTWGTTQTAHTQRRSWKSLVNNWHLFPGNPTVTLLNFTPPYINVENEFKDWI